MIINPKMNGVVVLLPCVLLAGCSRPTWAAKEQPAEPPSLEEQAAEYRRAFLAQDFEKVADFTYLEAYERFGQNRAKTIEMYKELAAIDEKDELGKKDLILSPPLESRESRGRRYAVVPMTVKISHRDGGAGTYPSFLLAVSSDGGVA